jgi:hypothetical protein
MFTMSMRRGPVPAARLLVALMAVLLAAVGVVATPHRAMADAAGRGGDFVPLTGSHVLLDTRTGTGAAKGTRGAGTTTVFPVAGVAGVPSTGVSAVLVSLLAVASSGTYLMAYPDGSPRPNPGSMVNATAGQTMANMAVIPIGSNGKADVYTLSTSDIVVEVEGYFTTTTGTTGGGFVPVPMTRLVDTRNGIGVAKAKIPANGSITATIATGSPISTTAGSAMLNVTVIGTSTGWVGVFPGGTTTGNSAVDYVSGTASSTAVAKLGSGGKVTIANHGATAVDVILDAEGYFTDQPTTGAGLRLVPAVRLLDTNTATVAAGATVDVQVGGTHGLPTRDIAGALLDLTVASAATGGYLTAWPVGGNELAPYSLTAFPGSNAQSDLVAVTTGTEGKVRIRNHSSGTIRLIVDLQGWFEDPLPAVAPASYTPTQVVQGLPAAGATVGALEYAYVNNIGQVLYGHQPDPSNSLSVQWTVISANEAYSGLPALAVQPNGQLRLAAEHGDSNIWSALQASNSTTWGTWANNGGSMASAPVVGRQTDGSLVLFAVDANGELWDLPQSGANGTFGSWHPFGVTGLTGSLTVTTVQTGIAVFAVDTSGALRTATLATGNTLSAWTSLGGSGLTATPAVVIYPGYRTRVFARGSDGVIVTKMQDVSGAWPADFTPIGSTAMVGSPSAVLSPASGKTEIVARGTDGNVYSTGETTQGSGVWRDWVNVTNGDTAATDPTAFTFNPGTGLTWAFVFRNADNQSRLYTVNTSGLNAAAATPGVRPSFTQKAIPAPPR